MRFSTFLSGFFTTATTTIALQTANIYLQPLPSSKSSLLAQITYDPLLPATATVTTYEAPLLPEDTELVRIAASKSTLPDNGKALSLSQLSTTVAGVENFEKGFQPVILLSVDQRGEILGATVKGMRVDAGATRDSGPRVVVLVSEEGKQPELNKPIILLPGGKKIQEEEQKTFLQKYWMFILVVVLLLMSGGGGGGDGK